MSDLKTLLERADRAVSDVPLPSSSGLERLQRRRDRRRRNERIAAGSVGMALFVAAAVIAGSVGLSDRSRPTGSAETGPTATGPAEPDEGWDGQGLPPKGTPLSMPVEGEVVSEYAEIHVGFVYVYADGRVIWMQESMYVGADPVGTRERRLTPAGVDLARSGVVEPSAFLPPWTSLPADIWADDRSEVRTYVPARYAVCFLDKQGNRVDPSGVVGLLPARAEALLRGKEHTYDHSAGLVGDFPPVTCSEVATDEARVLVGILAWAGFEQPEQGSLSFMLPEGSGEQISITFDALLPQGEWVAWGG